MRRATFLKCICLVLMCLVSPTIYLLHSTKETLPTSDDTGFEVHNGRLRSLQALSLPETSVDDSEDGYDEIALPPLPSLPSLPPLPTLPTLPSTPSSGSRERNKCEVVHIAMVLSGSRTIKQLLIMVKSILFYRHCPIHFHFLSDSKTEAIVSTVFTTWHLPEVDVSFYSLLEAASVMKWLPYSHESSMYGLAKLTLVRMLPSSLGAVVVLDTDLMVASDIGQLWEFVSHLQSKKKMLGLVENQNDRHLVEGEVPWPVSGRGYGSEVILLNLDLLRSTDWSKTWQSAAKSTLKAFGEEQFTVRDVINAVVINGSSSVLALPCVWNIQLSRRLSDYCTESLNDFKIVQTKSVSASNRYAPHFQNLLQMFENFDSMLFRTYISDCQVASTSQGGEEEDAEDPCLEQRREAKLERRVHPYFLNYSYQSTSEVDVTLVTQTSMDRLHMLEPLCKHWDGPLSIALYASDADLEEVLAHISSSQMLRSIERLALHVVSKAGKFYPYNQLRNIAMDYVKTPYVYILDMDFLPNLGLYQYAKQALTFLGDKKKALIVPAFETFHYQVKFPTNKAQLLSLLKDGTIFTFRYYAFRGGHAPTKFEHWKTAQRPYPVKWAKGFEPYLIMSSSIPRFDERFIGYGGDKVSHVQTLVSEGYELVVLPKAFMVHMPHPLSRERITFRQRANHYNCIKIFQEEFNRELNQTIH